MDKDNFCACNNPACKSIFGEPKSKQSEYAHEIDIRRNWDYIKAELQRKFKRGDIGLLIATKGFGMGIDKPNVRFVIHATLP